MKIKNIEILGEGYVYCKSSFYSAQDILSNFSNNKFSLGINKLIDEIDAGNWAASYLLSMYKHRPKDFVLFHQPKIIINNESASLFECSKISCYMDKLDPLFSSNSKSVKKLVKLGLNKSKLDYSCEDLKKIFKIDDERFEKPLVSSGNEIFKAMAAIGFSWGKEIFCFPWLSGRRFASYHQNLTDLLQILENLGKLVIIPIGISRTKLDELY